MVYKTSNEELAKSICEWEADEIVYLIKLLESSLSLNSLELSEKIKDIIDVPPVGTNERKQLCEKIVFVIGWYGSNSVAYFYRYINQGNGSIQYSKILKDVVLFFNKQLQREHRHKIPVMGSFSELEEKLVEIILGLQYKGKNNEEVIQILEDYGVDSETAKSVVKKYGPSGLAAASLPFLVTILGKKTVMTIVQQMIIIFIGKYIGKEAAAQMARRFAVKFAQRTFARVVSGIGWALLGIDILLFITSPARRKTLKAVPYISFIRTQRQMKD